jgi:hypothetical protein
MRPSPCHRAPEDSIRPNGAGRGGVWPTPRSVVASSTLLGAVAYSRLSDPGEISTGLCTLSTAGRSVTPLRGELSVHHNL